MVAAAIDARLRETGDECVYLDARAVERFAQRFPTVTAACQAAGIDPTGSRSRWCPVPTTAAAAWPPMYGRTELPGLLAAGEVARTGMRGANRLASNSLLEGLVVGGRAGGRRPGMPAAGPVTAQAGVPGPARSTAAICSGP